MLTFYLETSAWFKKFRHERGTEVMAELFAGARQDERFITSSLTLLEMDMTAARYLKGGLLTRRQYRRLTLGLSNDIGRYRLEWMPLSDNLIDEARVLAPQHPLRAADALHFATARIVARSVAGQPYYVVTADRELADVCTAYGLAVLDPQASNGLASLRALR